MNQSENFNTASEARRRVDQLHGVFYVNTAGDCDPLSDREKFYLAAYNEALRDRNTNQKEIETLRQILEDCGGLANVRRKQVLRKCLIEFLDYEQEDTDVLFERMALVGKIDRELKIEYQNSLNSQS